MAEVIQFPQRGETKTLHFDERHAFGQEQGREDGPVTLVLLGGVDGFFPLEAFEATEEGYESAKIAGEIALRALAVGHTNWVE
jgi:hypothetical protein